MNVLDELKAKQLTGDLTLSEFEGKAFLNACGISTPLGFVVTSLDEARVAARAVGYPLVIKGQVEAVTHKSEHGLVDVGIVDEVELERRYIEMQAKCGKLSAEYKILVEQMKKGKIELVVGLTHDPVFGKVIMFGLGGIFVEVMQDVSFGVCPITRDYAHEMITSLHCAKIFSGVRGSQPINISLIEDLLLMVGGENGLSEQFGQTINTIEINPVIVDEWNQLWALDAIVSLLPTDGGKLKQSQEQPDLDKLFHPRSMAIVGISPGKPSLAHGFMSNAIKAGFSGRIYPVNPARAGEEVMGYKIYGDIADIDDPIDYVYVAIPAKEAAKVVRSAGLKQAKFVQIISGGFSETGTAGAAMEKEVMETAQQYGIRLIGPNCLGLFSSRAGISFINALDSKPGDISIISQSGALTGNIIHLLSSRGKYFNYAISVGNCIDLDIPEYLEYMGSDENTKVIGVYAEQIKDGSRMANILKRVCLKKPVVIIKGGRSEAGAKAAASHTGALGSSYRLVEAMCAQCGAVLVRTLEEFLHVLAAFQSLIPSVSNDILLFSHTGGVVVSSTDLCGDYGLVMPPLDADLQDELYHLGLPPGASTRNPIDIPIGTIAARLKEGEKIGEIRAIFELVAKRRDFSYSLFILMADTVINSKSGKFVLRDIVDFAIEWGGFGAPEHGKFAIVIQGGCEPEFLREQIERASMHGVPVYPDAASMLMSIGRLVEYASWLERNSQK